MNLFSIKSIKECSGSVVILILILGILGSLYTTKEAFISGALFPESVSEAALSPPFGDRPMIPMPKLQIIRSTGSVLAMEQHCCLKCAAGYTRRYK